jgi:hypothetical protein
LQVCQLNRILNPRIKGITSLKKKIRLAKNILMPTPARDAVLAEQPYKGEFGIFIAARTNARHDIRSFCFGEDIGHGCSNFAGRFNFLSALPEPLGLNGRTNFASYPVREFYVVVLSTQAGSPYWIEHIGTKASPHSFLV